MSVAQKKTVSAPAFKRRYGLENAPRVGAARGKQFARDDEGGEGRAFVRTAGRRTGITRTIFQSCGSAWKDTHKTPMSCPYSGGERKGCD